MNLRIRLRRPALYPLSYGGVYDMIPNPGLSVNDQQSVFMGMQALYTTLKFFAWEHNPSPALPAFDADVRAGARDLPFEASTWVRLPHLYDIPCFDLNRAQANLLCTQSMGYSPLWARM